MRRNLILLGEDISSFSRGWYLYIRRNLRRFGMWFERNKGVLVDVLMARRGTYQRPFLHISFFMLLVVGVAAAPILANAYPGALPTNLQDFTPPSAVATSLDLTEYGVQTQVSDKPRDQVITYEAQEGDTLSTIAEKFGVSVDTVKWANDLKRDSLKVGQTLKIPPVSGVVHKVREGETVYTIAKRYKTDAQKIVNFPFNDFTDLDTFALAVGQTLIVPDGAPPAAPSIARFIPSQLAAGGSGELLWPAAGAITQYPVWYHMAVDIANPGAPGIAAADGGTVVLVEYARYAYGYHVIIDHGRGITTLYAHMSDIYVRVGDSVAIGQVIGKMGSTGRSTGTHLHFEVRRNGVAVNPLSYLK